MPHRLVPLSLLAALCGCAVSVVPAPADSVAAAASSPVAAPVAMVAPPVTPAAPAPLPAKPAAVPASGASHPHQRRLLGATYVRRDSLPKVVGIGWKTVQALSTGSNGDADLFVVEKNHERRLLLATAQKFWARSLYRYAVRAELSIPATDRDISLAGCASAGSAAVDELALFDLRQGAAITWLARRSGNRLLIGNGSSPSAHSCRFPVRGQTVSQSLSG